MKCACVCPNAYVYVAIVKTRLKLAMMNLGVIG